MFIFARDVRNKHNLICYNIYRIETCELSSTIFYQKFFGNLKCTFRQTSIFIHILVSRKTTTTSHKMSLNLFKLKDPKITNAPLILLWFQKEDLTMNVFCLTVKTVIKTKLFK